MRETKKLLREMMVDEKKAPYDYIKLKKKLKPIDKKIISSIIKDERRHLRLLKKMKRRY